MCSITYYSISRSGNFICNQFSALGFDKISKSGFLFIDTIWFMDVSPASFGFSMTAQLRMLLRRYDFKLKSKFSLVLLLSPIVQFWLLASLSGQWTLTLGLKLHTPIKAAYYVKSNCVVVLFSTSLYHHILFYQWILSTNTQT